MSFDTVQYQEIEAAFRGRSKYSLQDILEQSSEVVVFGSYARGLQRPGSDLDLLCVDFPKRIKSPRIDIVRFSKSYLHSEQWLTSELANHIAEYGVWLKGTAAWKSQVKITAETIWSKYEQIIARLARVRPPESLDRLESRARFTKTEIDKLRRDLQRLSCLKAKRATPPTAQLDEEWNSFMRSSIISQFRSELDDVNEYFSSATARVLRLYDNY